MHQDYFYNSRLWKIDDFNKELFTSFVSPRFQGRVEDDFQ